MHEDELTALARAVQEGREESFRVLVESLSRALVAMAYRYVRDWESARDLTQETWIKVHRNMARWNPERSFTAWLHAIHRNGCLDHLRRGWVRRESMPGNDAVVRLAGATPEDPEAALERREFHDRLVAAMDGLSESQRQVFLRVDVERGDQRSAARELGIKPNTLRATLHFARKRVAAALRAMEESTQ